MFMAALVVPGAAGVERLRRRISSASGLEDAPCVFSGRAASARFACLAFASADGLTSVSSIDFAQLKGATSIPVWLVLCFISAKGWELPVFPICGIWIPAAGPFAGVGGKLVRLFLPERMPMSVHWDRCGMVDPCRWLLRLHMRGSSSTMAAGQGGGPRRAVAMAGRRGRRGDRRNSWKACSFAKKSPVYFFAFLYGFQGVVENGGCTVDLN